MSFQRPPLLRDFAAKVPMVNHEDDAGNARQETPLQTLLELVDYNAQHNPEYLFCIQQIRTSSSQELLAVSHQQLKGMVINCKERLAQQMKNAEMTNGGDRSANKKPTIALLVESDISLYIHLLALMSLNKTVLLLSPRLSPEAVQNLLSSTEAQAIVSSQRFRHVASAASDLFTETEAKPALLDNLSLQTLRSLPEPMDLSSPLARIRDQSWTDTDRDAIIFHSSGTTGFPKAIYQAHRLLMSAGAPFEASRDENGVGVLVVPLFHAYGAAITTRSLTVGLTICLPCPSKITTGTSMIDLVRDSKAQYVTTVPSILEEAYQAQGGASIEILKSLTWLSFGGGPLDERIGDQLRSHGVPLVNAFGASETALLTEVTVPEGEYDWRYVRFRKDMGIKLEPQPSGKPDQIEVRISVLPPGWDTPFVVPDNFVANPEKPETEFKALGRTDDVIVLATGEKIQPNVLKNALVGLPQVSHAFPYGTGQFEMIVVIVPSQEVSPADMQQFRAQIWPTILEVGKQMDGQAQILSPEAILVLPHDIEIPLTDKGSIKKNELLQRHQSLIDATYKALDLAAADTADPLDWNNLETGLKSFIQNRLRWKIPSDDWSIDRDLFELGMDSLQALRLNRYLVVQTSDTNGFTGVVDRNFVYSHPTIASMASALKHKGINGHHASKGIELVNKFIRQYSLPEALSAKPRSALLTGSTGSLGINLLRTLASNTRVAHVICLNRPKANTSKSQDPLWQQRAAASSRSISLTEEEWSKVRALNGDGSSANLGLSPAEYGDLCSSVTDIIQCGFPVDFKRQVSSFESQFATTHNLVKIIHEKRTVDPELRPRLLFLSSIGVVRDYVATNGQQGVPEVPAPEEWWANTIGYTQAKVVCEKILENASQQFDLDTPFATVRIGQISGSAITGAWNSSEYIPALLKSSQIVGALPKLSGTLSWVPVDLTARVLIDILLTQEPLDQVYHLENPCRQSWSDLIDLLSVELSLPIIGYQEWLDKCLSDNLPDASGNPVSALSEFFETDFVHSLSGQTRLDTSKSQRLSNVLRGTKAVGDDVVRKYLEHWRHIQYLV